MRTLALVMITLVSLCHSGFGDEIGVRWQSAARNSVVVSWTPPVESMTRCAEGGLTYAVRYEVRICELRLLWRDTCDSIRVDHRVTQDPISRSVTVQSDVMRDPEPPREHQVISLGEAIAEVAQHTFPLGIPAAKRNGRVLKARVSAACRGSETGFLERLPGLLTLGLLTVASSDSGEFDSRWSEFSLRE